MVFPHAPRPETPIRVVLADAHAVVRRNLRLLLDGEDDVEVIAASARRSKRDSKRYDDRFVATVSARGRRRF